MSSIAPLLSVLFAGLVIAAAAADLLTMKIPNWISLALVALFPLAALAAGLDLYSTGLHLAVGFTVLALGFTLFAFGYIGGGDAKFAAAVAVWMGPSIALVHWFILATMLGAVLTFVLLAVRRMPLPVMLASQNWISRLHDHRTGVPYGIALGVAALIASASTEIFRGLALS